MSTSREEVHKTMVALRELLAVPERWTQWGNAKDAKGDIVPYYDPKAVRFCINDGLLKVCDVPQDPHNGEGMSWDPSLLDACQDQLDECVKKKVGPMARSTFNDGHTHEEVLEVIDCAVESTRA